MDYERHARGTEGEIFAARPELCRKTRRHRAVHRAKIDTGLLENGAICQDSGQATATVPPVSVRS